MTNIEVINRIEELQKTFVHYRFWNHDPSSANDPNSVTLEPCNHHSSGCTTNGSCGCNSFAGGRQCFAFALYIAYLTFGSYPIYTSSTPANGGDCGNGWKKYNSGFTSSLKLEPGDIVRCSGHSAIVWYVSGDLFQVGEVLGDPPNAKDNCRINWGNFNGSSNNRSMSSIISNAEYIIKAPKTYSKIKNAGSGKFLTVLNSEVGEGKRVVQLTNNGLDNQKWDVMKYDIKTFLDLDYGIKLVLSEGSQCKIYDTSSETVSPVVVESSGSYYFIKSDSGSSPYYLVADASGANVYWTQSNDTSAYKKWIIS